MNTLSHLTDLLRKPPKASAVSSIQSATHFKALHARATKYLKSNKHTGTKTLSLISELQAYQ